MIKEVIVVEGKDDITAVKVYFFVCINNKAQVP